MLSPACHAGLGWRLTPTPSRQFNFAEPATFLQALRLIEGLYKRGVVIDGLTTDIVIELLEDDPEFRHLLPGGEQDIQLAAACGGICVGFVAALVYLTIFGGGNPLEGLEVVADGNDPLQRLLNDVSGVVYSTAKKNAPDTTKLVVETLKGLAGRVDAVVTYIDDETGNVVSKHWEDIDSETRKKLNGAAVVLGVVLSGGTAKAVKEVVGSGLPKGKAKKLEPGGSQEDRDDYLDEASKESDENGQPADAPNRTVPSGSPYSQADYDAYVQRKLDAGETPLSPEDYISVRQQFDKGSAAHTAAVETEVDILQNTYGPNARIVENRAVSSADGCVTCRPDIMVFDADTNTLHVVEVKTGNADLTPNQQQVYPNIADGSASMNASQLQALGLPTEYACPSG